jgi:hypothetical protein
VQQEQDQDRHNLLSVNGPQRTSQGAHLQRRALEAIEGIDIHLLGQEPLSDLVGALTGRQMAASSGQGRGARRIDAREGLDANQGGS